MAAASEPRYSAVIPILNKGCSIPSSVPLPLSEEITLQKIRGDDLAAITEFDDDAFGLLKGGSFVLAIAAFNPHQPALELNSNVSAALFTLNVLGAGTPASIDKVYVLRTVRKTSVSEKFVLGGHRHGNLDRFQIAKGTDLSYCPELFNAVSHALTKHSALRITISRFNSAIGRTSEDDKLIDLCIALESIFDSRTEISFQFALYNSILAESDAEKRVGIFKTLRNLYTERSNIVHGTKGTDPAWLADKWADLLRITKASILRKIEFLRDGEHKDWKDYLERLALGYGDGKEVT
jgi:hypothetical protein